MLYDDRDLGPGEKFAEAELLGCPLRLTVGRTSLESGEVEVQMRRGRESAPGLPLNGEPGGAPPGGGRAVAEPPVESPSPGPPLTIRRLVGLDRSGPPPPQTRPASRCGRGRCRTRSASCGSR